MLAEVAELVRSREMSAVEMVRRAYERVGSLNGDLNAVVALRDEEEAVAEARGLDDRILRGERLGPLAGVPFLVKDAQDLAGMRTTNGSLLLAEAAPATRDALNVARLRAAGAIPVGKTNVPEFCFEGFTDNRLFGVTRNPWAPEWSPGGSSGGSAAAMAAGMVPFATATDGGGSIRIPAAFCGLFGHKPTSGLVPRDPIPAWLDYSTDGPLAMSMADVRLLLALESGPTAGDPTALPAEQAAQLAGAAAASRRPSLVLAAPRFVDWGPLPNAVADALRRRAHESREGSGRADRADRALADTGGRWQRRRRLVGGVRLRTGARSGARRSSRRRRTGFTRCFSPPCAKASRSLWTSTSPRAAVASSTCAPWTNCSAGIG